MIDNEFSEKVLRFKTWVPQEIGGSMIEEAVRASDFDALQQQLDALELSRRSWMDEAKSLEKIAGELVIERDASRERDAALREELVASKRSLTALAELDSETLGSLQQRLAEADERANLLERLLRKMAWNVLMTGTQAEIDEIDAALNSKAVPEVFCRGDARLGTACGKFSRCIRATGIESLAKQIYQSWESLPGFHPWVEGGNSLKQQEARQIASRTFELALSNQVEPLQ